MCMIKVIFKYSNRQIFLLQKKIKNTTGRPLSLLNESYRPDIIIIEFFSFHLLVTCCIRNYKESETEEMENRSILLISCSTHICITM